MLGMTCRGEKRHIPVADNGTPFESSAKQFSMLYAVDARVNHCQRIL